MTKKCIALGFMLVLMINIAGCGKKGFMQSLAGNKVGIVWEGEPSYSWLASSELKKRTKLLVVDDQNLPLLKDYQFPQTLQALRNQHHLDYLLVLKIPYLGDVEQKSNFQVVQQGVRININYIRKVQLAYKVIAVPTGEMLASGISQGEGSHSTYMRFDSKGASANMTPKDEEELTIAALRSAMRRADLY